MKFVAALFLASRLFAEQPCPAALPAVSPKGTTIFSPQQEGYLGDAIAAMVEQRIRTYPPSGLTAPLEVILARLQAQFPTDGYQFRISLMELPEANAFVLAGGRIYVSR